MRQCIKRVAWPMSANMLRWRCLRREIKREIEMRWQSRWSRGSKLGETTSKDARHRITSNRTHHQSCSLQRGWDGRESFRYSSIRTSLHRMLSALDDSGSATIISAGRSSLRIGWPMAFRAEMHSSKGAASGRTAHGKARVCKFGQYSASTFRSGVDSNFVRSVKREVSSSW